MMGERGTTHTFTCWIPGTYMPSTHFCSHPTCCTGKPTPAPNRCARPSSHQSPQVPQGSATCQRCCYHPLCTEHPSDTSWETSGSKAAADGDKKCFQCSKTITLLCLIKFSAAIRYPKAICLFEKNICLFTHLLLHLRSAHHTLGHE